MTIPAPHTWSDLGLPRPLAGESVLDPAAPVFVRGYREAEDGVPGTFLDFADRDFAVSRDRLIDDDRWPIVVGATVVYIGAARESRDDVAVYLWEPARVWWLGEADRRHGRDALTVFPASPRVVLRDELDAEIRQVVFSAVEKGTPLDTADRVRLAEFWDRVPRD